MKHSLLILLVCLCLSAKAADTLQVISHNKVTVVTDPSNGENEYARWAKFPSVKEPVRKILLHVRFACPDTMRCADWDYLDFIKIKNAKLSDGTVKDAEIARMLTPYGGAFKKDWNFEWTVDVTDFAPLLKDSVEISYIHTGWEPNKDRGWLITLRFEIIRGTPSALPIAILPVYSGNFKYGNDAEPVENNLKPFSITDKSGKATFAKLKIYQTGHGANEGDACAEFCSKKRSIYFNGNLIDEKSMWKKCGDNPLYPQAGTWLFDRANWCPGDLQQPDEYILPLAKNVINVVDVNMEKYSHAKSEATENITAYIFLYAKSNFNNDVRLASINVPNNNELHQRRNPACANPAIIVENNGAAPLKNITILYGTNGARKQSYIWQGYLPYGKKATIELPGNIEAHAGKNQFSVAVTKPNGKADEYMADNQLSTIFEKAPVHTGNMVVVFKANKQPEHNSYTITSSDGKKIAERTFSATDASKIFRDSLKLSPGCYTLMVADTAGDGLEFWANSKGGRGYIRLQDGKGNLLRQFESDFGSEVYYSFIVDENAAIQSAVNKEISLGLYPTRTTGKTELDFFSGTEQDVLVQIITDEGAVLVEEHKYSKLKEGLFTYDLSYRKPQRYYLKVFINGELKFNKRIRVVDKVD